MTEHETEFTEEFGDAFALNAPIYGPTVVVTDPDLVRQVFLASPEELGNIQPNMSRVFGSGSVFALDGAAHRRRRNLLGPLFHGRSVRAYEQVFLEETLREIADWPEGREFETLPPMNRITLSAILRALFGAEGAELDELRRLIPDLVTLGSQLVTQPMPSGAFGPLTPWGRFTEGRRQYEAILDRLIADAQADPDFEQRSDVLSVFLRSRYEDGSTMSRKEIGDELATLIAAGHETTSSTLAWVFERLSRQPELLARLAAEADTDQNTLRRAAIREVQRVRPVGEFVERRVNAPYFQLGDRVIPHGYSVIVSVAAIHRNPAAFKDPECFDPQRYIDGNPSAFEWIPFGGGSRRCPGSTFATLEMDLVLRTVLRHFTIETTTAPGEALHARGVAVTPKLGGRITVRRRAVG